MNTPESVFAALDEADFGQFDKDLREAFEVSMEAGIASLLALNDMVRDGVMGPESVFPLAMQNRIMRKHNDKMVIMTRALERVSAAQRQKEVN